MSAKHKAPHKLLKLNNKRNREATTTKCREKNIKSQMKKCTRQLQVRARFKFKTNKFSDWIKLEITRVARENKTILLEGRVRLLWFKMYNTIQRNSNTDVIVVIFFDLNVSNSKRVRE